MLGNSAAQNTLRGEKHSHGQRVARCKPVSLAACAALDVRGKISCSRRSRLGVGVKKEERLSGDAR